MGLGFLVNKLLWSGLGFLVCIILLRFGDVVSMHCYLNVLVIIYMCIVCQSLRVHSMPTKFPKAIAIEGEP